MPKKSNILRFVGLVLFASLCACSKTVQPPVATSQSLPAVVYVPEPVVEPADEPAPTPDPVSVEPDHRWLPGHSSYTTPVPVEPVEVDEMGPVISE